MKKIIVSISAAASAMGRKGGKSKSPAKKAAGKENAAAATAVRMKKTPAERIAQARAAANARWGKK